MHETDHNSRKKAKENYIKLIIETRKKKERKRSQIRVLCLERTCGNRQHRCRSLMPTVKNKISQKLREKKKKKKISRR